MILQVTMYLLIGLLSSLLVGRGANGDITMSPINKAVLFGTYNVTMSCVSSIGYSFIAWSYIPVGTSSAVTISSGSTVVQQQQQFYAVEQSSGSEQNNLIIHRATTTRAGTYICAEGATQIASAQLIVINSDPVCSMTPNAPAKLLFNQTVQMMCSITYTANSYVGVDMRWSKDDSAIIVSNAPPNTTTSANLTTATSTIIQTPGYSSLFPIYRCNTTFKISGNPTGSANNAPDCSKLTQLNSPIIVIYLRPASPSSITGAKDGDQVYLGTTVTCTVDGNPSPSYSWLDDNPTYGNRTNTSTIQIWHGGNYQCTAWNTAGSTSVSIIVRTYSTFTTAAPTTSTSTTPTTTVTSRSTVQSGSSGGGGLSYGGKIGIGVGIGVGGTMVLIGVLFAVLCRRYEITTRAKPDDRMGNAMEENTERSRTNRDNSNTPQYEPLDALLVQTTNPGPTYMYEQLTAPTNVMATEQSLPNISASGSGCLNADQSCSTNYDGLQQRESMASDVYQSIIFRH